MARILICTECKSPQREGYWESSPFIEPPCNYCGGVCQFIEERGVEQFMRQRDRQRGLFHMDIAEEEEDEE